MMPVSLARACRSLALSTWLLSFCFVHLLSLDFTVAEKEEWYTAFVNISYAEAAGGGAEWRSERSECGRYGQHSLKQDARGVLALPAPHDRLGCDPHSRFASPPSGPGGPRAWIALVPRGNCTYREKIWHAARQNASAVVIYNVGAGNVNETITMPHAGTGDIVAIMIPELKGREIMSLLEKNVTIMMYITIGTRNLQKYVSRTSVVFVSISFIVLMIISLAWLVFYYIQRFRYANARDRNQRRLGDAAKKAISKLQVRTIKKGDKETESDFDNCAVCIEGYKPNDVVRILPCRHLFHKTCVDPWLLDHRTCPMCKMNILKALGIPPNADCADDVTTDFEGSIGGPPTNQITGASDVTVNESSVGLDTPVRTIGLSQIIQDSEALQQVEEVNITTSNNDEERVVSSDSDTSLILAVEVGLSDVELSTDQDCEEVKS
ncbi:RING finger protein 150a isoform X1 [Callorhinchus milii]|uniref:RING finger protein 150a isoform X1 n=1 Tax=Callorhinchus milii TaxID=7868 RepID=UPI0004574F03|nr:RING finger protein 150a isoform X1 [Callorhinchus milii]|eukprot:gi/632959815/ref/XP_007895841.1/ PREDICTED: RING finger protein 150 [Callorhinchus milii]